ncbi:hypothetical protein Hamer_G018674 [Homarus americanus]|uniref:Uncharacterized protein n=1 Tax=Homarus americanus TaxID=6706 RepID=A0A8J5N5G6_HOMAM|nr:hypothetical protein Hamer_G018674 [Homarus americanus]
MVVVGVPDVAVTSVMRSSCNMSPPLTKRNTACHHHSTCVTNTVATTQQAREKSPPLLNKHNILSPLIKRKKSSPLNKLKR